MSEPNASWGTSWRTRTRSLALEGLKLFGIAIACLLTVGLTVWISAQTGIVIPMRWIGLVVWTGVLIWAVLRQFEVESRHFNFWAAFVVLLAVHTFVFAQVLERYQNWRAAWFPLVIIIEAPCMAMLLQSTIDRKHRRCNRK